MDDDTLNMNIRKFLKQVGVTSQRQIESAVSVAMTEGRLKGNENLIATMTLEIPELGLKVNIDGDIGLA